MEETKEAVVTEQAPTPSEASTGAGSNPAALSDAVANFEKELKRRSFSGRNPELGRMIKCGVCRRRHRESERRCEQKFANKPGTPEGESDPMIAEPKHYHPEHNPFWRAHPGTMAYVKELKKYVRIVQ
jgi:hypothetical protein